MKNLKAKIHILTYEIFKYSLGVYLILLLIETTLKGFVSYFFDMTNILFVVIITGLITIFTRVPIISLEEEKATKATDIANSLILASGLGFFSYYFTRDLGILAIVIAFLVVLLTSFIIYQILIT